MSRNLFLVIHVETWNIFQIWHTTQTHPWGAKASSGELARGSLNPTERECGTRLIFLLCVLDRVASFKLYLVHSLRMQTESLQFNCKCNIWKKKEKKNGLCAHSCFSSRTTQVICAQPVSLAVTWSFLYQLIPFWFNSPYDWLSARLTVGKISLNRPRP